MSEPEHYVVRLVMGVVATTPELAAPTFVEHLVTQGMRDWVYRVEKEDGEIVGYYDGNGSLVPDEVLHGKPDEEEVNEGNTAPLPLVHTSDDDASLVEFAATLNEGDSPGA